MHSKGESLSIGFKSGNTNIEPTVSETLNCGEGAINNISTPEKVCFEEPNTPKNDNRVQMDDNSGAISGVESEIESNLSGEGRQTKPPIVPCYCNQSSHKEKKKKKKNKGKQKHNLMEECLLHEEEWWSDQVFSFSEEEELIQAEISKLTGSNGYSNVEIEEESTFESGQHASSADEGKSHQVNPTVSPRKKKKNKIFPTSKRLADPRSLFMLRPRFLKFALGVCTKSRKKFTRKDMVKYMIDNPPNSKPCCLVLKPV